MTLKIITIIIKITGYILHIHSLNPEKKFIDTFPRKAHCAHVALSPSSKMVKK